ncbi:MAG: AAA family ATPase [Ruminococcus sp.]|nr:AAA family ATPase [Ruminococcus sp.]MDE6849244.1 AAA family ATPase [Ruminococcus sp.]MDE7137282.1 AAA family ATPase [Ruminococcus sp.]
MYTGEQLELLDKVETLKKEKNLSQNAVGQLIGVSGASLSQLRNGKYNANPQKIFDTLASYFEVKEKAKLTYSEIGYAPTSISEQVYVTIALCQKKGGLAVACGDAGIGKTKAAQKFVTDNPSNSFLITINPCLTNTKSLLKTIADSIGAGQEKSNNELWHSITGKLSDGKVLIFDESQHLTVKAIEVLRSFSDYFNDKGQTLGICFIGNAETIIRMGAKKAEFAQIANRTKQRKIYKNTEIQRDDICKLFPVLESGNMNSEIDFLLRVARTPQALRGAINLFSNAYDNDDISLKGLIGMARYMDMEV